MNLGFIWTLYANQILNAAVKVYMMWRLAKQKWANRGNQKQGMAGPGLAARARDAMAAYLTTLSFFSILLVVMLYTKLLTLPSFGFVSAVFFR